MASIDMNPVHAYVRILEEIHKCKVQAVYSVQANTTSFYGANVELLAVYNHDTENMAMAGITRSKEVAIQIVQFKDKCVLNIAIDRTPERSYTFENPMSLAEAFMFMAGEIRLEGNKWGPDGSDQPDNAAN